MKQPPKTERRPRRWRQGIWTARDQMILLSILIWQAMVRGIDYTKGLAPESADYLLLSSAFTQQAIGLAFIVPACLLVVGMSFNIHSVAWTGHVLLSGSYTITGVSLLLTSSMLLDNESVLGLAVILALGAVLMYMTATCKISGHPIKTVVLTALLIFLLFSLPEGPDGSMRAPGFYVSMGMAHMFWGLRMGPTPLEDDEVDLDEVVVR